MHRKARSIKLLCRRTSWHLPERFLGFISTKSVFFSRISEYWFKLILDRKATKRRFRLVDAVLRVIDFLTRIHLGMLQDPLRPSFPLRHSVGTTGVGIGGEASLRAIHQGHIQLLKGEIESLTSSGLRLRNGTMVKADTLVRLLGLVQIYRFLMKLLSMQSKTKTEILGSTGTLLTLKSQTSALMVSTPMWPFQSLVRFQHIGLLVLSRAA